MINVITVTDEGYKSTPFSIDEFMLLKDALNHTIESNSNYNDDAKDKDIAEYIEDMRSVLTRVENLSEER
jgi:hypothetical protein